MPPFLFRNLRTKMRKGSLISSVFGLSKYMLNNAVILLELTSFANRLYLISNISSLVLGLGRLQNGKRPPEVLRLMDQVQRKQSRTRVPVKRSRAAMRRMRHLSRKHLRVKDFFAISELQLSGLLMCPKTPEECSVP